MFNSVLKSFNRAKPSSMALKTKSMLPATAKAAFSSESKREYAPWENSRILLTGCQGQIGVPLVRALCEELGAENIIASDLSEQKFDFPCKYE